MKRKPRPLSPFLQEFKRRVDALARRLGRMPTTRQLVALHTRLLGEFTSPERRRIRRRKDLEAR